MKRTVLIPNYIKGDEQFCDGQDCYHFKRANTGAVCILGENVEQLKPNGCLWERCVKCLYGERRMLKEITLQNPDKINELETEKEKMLDLFKHVAHVLDEGVISQDFSHYRAFDLLCDIVKELRRIRTEIEKNKRNEFEDKEE
ncbi:MAG: hypothetical protein EOM51_11860 [Clostridia bacterium]|nr:hypothetical protein [Clostridia bacterium]